MEGEGVVGKSRAPCCAHQIGCRVSGVGLFFPCRERRRGLRVLCLAIGGGNSKRYTFYPNKASPPPQPGLLLLLFDMGHASSRAPAFRHPGELCMLQSTVVSISSPRP